MERIFLNLILLSVQDFRKLAAPIILGTRFTINAFVIALRPALSWLNQAIQHQWIVNARITHLLLGSPHRYDWGLVWRGRVRVLSCGGGWGGAGGMQVLGSDRSVPLIHLRRYGPAPGGPTLKAPAACRAASPRPPASCLTGASSQTIHGGN